MPAISTRVIENGKFRIIIMDAPSDANSAAYVKELQTWGVTDVVRTCEPTYSPTVFENAGIRVREMMFPDGNEPPKEILETWVELLRMRYLSRDQGEAGIVAVHCVAGLGRAPVMAAVALMEITSVDPMDAVDIIRAKQKGAINARQLKFLQGYKRTTHSGGGCQPCCLM